MHFAALQGDEAQAGVRPQLLESDDEGDDAYGTDDGGAEPHGSDVGAGVRHRLSDAGSVMEVGLDASELDADMGGLHSAAVSDSEQKLSPPEPDRQHC